MRQNGIKPNDMRLNGTEPNEMRQNGIELLKGFLICNRMSFHQILVLIQFVPDKG
jgi:hypothetical protein